MLSIAFIRWFRICFSRIASVESNRASFSALSGMGDKAATDLEEAASKGAFTSKDDIRQRGKVSKTILDDMRELGILGELPDTNQYDFFSMLQ